MDDIVEMLRTPTGCVPPNEWELNGATEIERLRRCISMAMGCLSPHSQRPDERLAWYRLLDATEGREPRSRL